MARYCIETRDGGPPVIKRQSNGALTFEQARRVVIEYWMEQERVAHAMLFDAVLLTEAEAFDEEHLPHHMWCRGGHTGPCSMRPSLGAGGTG